MGIRARVIGWIRRHPRAAILTGLLGLGLFVAGFLWFEPHKLFVDDRVSEALPGTEPMAAASPTPSPSETQPTVSPEPEPSPEPKGPQTLARGRFISLEHASEGRALIVETRNGKRFLRFEKFATSNGPDLVVYLSSKPATEGDWYGYDEDFVDLGDLKGNIGDQNYELAADVDLDKYDTAVVWCRRFRVGFAAATLA